jgi:hypothetical protein
MNKNQRLLISVVLLGAYLLSACSGAVPQQREDSSQPSSSSQSTDVVFTGTVESVGVDQWLISGQAVGVGGTTVVAPAIQAGDIVKVQGVVSSDGKILALKIESSGAEDANYNATNSNDGNVNSNENANANDDNGNDNSNANANDNSNDASDDAREIVGLVQTITADSVTIDGVTYQFADNIELKNIILEGDQVKLHLVVTADGTILVRKIEKVESINGNDNGNSNDDDNNGNSNSNDDDNDNANDNGDDDDDDNDNSNDNG